MNDSESTFKKSRYRKLLKLFVGVNLIIIIERTYFEQDILNETKEVHENVTTDITEIQTITTSLKTLWVYFYIRSTFHSTNSYVLIKELSGHTRVATKCIFVFSTTRLFDLTFFFNEIGGPAGIRRDN